MKVMSQIMSLGINTFLIIFLFAATSFAQLTEGFEIGLPITAPTSATNYTLSSGVWTILKGLRTTTKHNGSYALNLNNGSSTASYALAPSLNNIATIVFWARGSSTSTLSVQKSVNGNSFTTVKSQRITSSYASYSVNINDAGNNIRIRFLNSTKQTLYLDDVTINYATPVPVLTISPITLGFGSITINTVSSEQILLLSGANLTPTSGNITLAAPDGYQISTTSGSGFASSINLSYGGGELLSTTIYVRFAPVSAQAYSNAITITGGGPVSQTVAVVGSGIATPIPVLVMSPTSVAFGNVIVNSISGEQNLTVSGLNLTPASGNVTVIAPNGYQVSTASGSGFASSINFPYSGGSLLSAKVYARFMPTVLQSYSGIMSGEGGGSAIVNVGVSGNGIAAPTPTLTVSPATLAFGNVTVNATSSEKAYTITGINLTPSSGTIAVTAPSGFEISTTSGTGFASSIAVTYSSSSLASTTVYARFTPTVLQSYSGIISGEGGGAVVVNVGVNGNGMAPPAPSLTVSPATLTFGNVTMNTTSSEKIYTITGLNLTPSSGTITITAPSGFEVSATTGTGFGPSIAVGYSGSTLASTTVYVRFIPTAVQSYSGIMTNEGGGAAAINVAVNGTGIAKVTTTSTSIYTETAFVSPWTDVKSWSCTRNYASLSPVYSGSTAILVTCKAWSALQIGKGTWGSFQNTDPASYDSLVFMIHGGILGVSLTLKVDNSTMTAIKIKAVAGFWERKSIPMSLLATVPFGTLYFDMGGATPTFSLDDIRLLKNEVSSNTPVLVSNKTSLVFGDAMMNIRSAEETCVISGLNLTPSSETITITAPSGFEVSTTSGTGFASSIAVAYSGSSLASTIVYVRFMPLAVQSYSGNITGEGGGAPTVNIAVSGNGIAAPTPTLTVNPATLTFGNVTMNTISREQMYALAGSNLTPSSGTITVAAPSGFEVSATSGIGFGPSLAVGYSGSTLASTTVYVRFIPTAIQSYGGIMTNEGGGTAAIHVAANGRGVDQLSILFPLGVSANNRYLKSPNGTPFFLNAEAAWSLIVQVSYADANTYLTDRVNRGFNGIMVNLIEKYFAANAPNNIHNVAPFTGTVFTSPNESYFAHADSVIDRANELGMVVLLYPIYLGYNCGIEGFCADIQSASTANMRTWGTYIGNRYKNYPNIIWVMGADCNPTAYSGDIQEKIDTMVAAMKEVDTVYSRLYTTHSERGTQAITHWPESWVNLNSVYTTSSTVVTLADDAYSHNPTLPFFFLEGYYEGDSHAPTIQQVRAQAYWSILRGSFGHVFGNCPMWNFGSGTTGCGTDWQAQLSSAGSVSMTYFKNIFESRHWYNLIPDLNASVLISGANSGTDLAVVAYVSDSTTIIGYLPTSRTVTIDPVKLRGDSTRWYWVDPGTGSWTTIGTYGKTMQSVTPAAGDWVLVIDGFSSGVIGPFESQNITVSKGFQSLQNFPNPFNPITTISFTLTEDSKVSLKVYDMLGRTVAMLVDGHARAGYLYQIPFDASRLASGIYIYRLQAGSNVTMKKLILMK